MVPLRNYIDRASLSFTVPSERVEQTARQRFGSGRSSTHRRVVTSSKRVSIASMSSWLSHFLNRARVARNSFSATRNFFSISSDVFMLSPLSGDVVNHRSRSCVDDDRVIPLDMLVNVLAVNVADADARRSLDELLNEGAHRVSFLLICRKLRTVVENEDRIDLVIIVNDREVRSHESKLLEFLQTRDLTLSVNLTRRCFREFDDEVTITNLVDLPKNSLVF